MKRQTLSSKVLYQRPVFVGHPTRTEKIPLSEVELRTKEYLALLRAFTAQEFVGKIESWRIENLLGAFDQLEQGLMSMARQAAEGKTT